jgi:uncharacterized membrane protein YeaQ/YmgE (transglycosylase-associated protein family)
MNLVLAGIVGTLVMTMLKVMAPKMGMPEMDIVGMLSEKFGKGNKTVGWIAHLMMGIVFVFVYHYSGYFDSYANAALLGVVHWLVVGFMMGVMPGMDGGFYMSKNGGMMSFVGGLLGHVVFALSAFFAVGLF